MAETLPTPVPDAPEGSLPVLLVEPPWVRNPQGEPVVLTGLKAPREPTAVVWAPGEREEWLGEPYRWQDSGKRKWRSFEPFPDDTDWAALAETFRAGRALSELDEERRRALLVGLLMQGPVEPSRELLADQRYWADLVGYPAVYAIKGIVARHELAALPLVMHRTRQKGRDGDPEGLTPFLDADIAQVMIKVMGTWPHGGDAVAWFERHGPAAARLTVPDALRKPGPKRTKAEDALRLVAERHGQEAVVEAARHYGEAAERAIAALRTDPLDDYPDPLPEPGEELDPARLPQILLRGRELALPASATRHFITMLLISAPHEPYPGVEPVVEACDPASLAEFAWALYRAEKPAKGWASPGVQCALRRLGDDETAARLADVVARWPKWLVWDRKGVTALPVFTAIGSDAALRHLHRLGQKAKDVKRIRPFAQQTLARIAKERGLSADQLADRLVPDLGLAADGSLTLDYGPRRFTVGFDEQLKPFVTDGDGKRRKTLPKPGVKDDGELAPAAYKAFTDLKKEVRTVAAEQIKRLERAMVTGRGWSAAEFRAVFVDHPLLWQIARRLVWSAETDGRVATFRVAEDRTLAGVDDDAYALPDTARVALPHPLLLGDELKAWSDVFADYELLQPFAQLGRPVHALTEEERGDRLARFEGVTVHFGRVLDLTSRGWELGLKETGGFHRQIIFRAAEDRRVMVRIEPGIRAFSPDEYVEQEIGGIDLWKVPHEPGRRPFGELDPVVASELLADLTRLTEHAPRTP